MQSGEQCWKYDLPNSMEIMQELGCFHSVSSGELHFTEFLGGHSGFSQEPQNCQFCEKEIALAAGIQEDK